jgi:hypothetical protein
MDHADENELLAELDMRHDELLRDLVSLDERIEAVLGEWLAKRECSEAPKH